MLNRKIVRIDEELCDGCGNCIDACHEGAIALVDGVATLVSDIYCDGLGDCLGECPQDAISIEEREAEAFDEEAVAARVKEMEQASEPSEPTSRPQFTGCPGSASQRLRSIVPSIKGLPSEPAANSTLANWPVQLHLVPVQAPYFEGAKLLIAADCVPFAHAGFHSTFLAGRTLIICCPKLDDVSVYLAKLTAIFLNNAIESVEVAHMEVPCCHGLVRLVQQALAASGREIPLSLTQVGIRGEIQA